MNRFIVTLAALGLTAGAALAQEVTDADGDGAFSLEEIQAAYPNATEETFALVDANGDGAVDAEELAAAVEAGVLAAE